MSGAGAVPGDGVRRATRRRGRRHRAAAVRRARRRSRSRCRWPRRTTCRSTRIRPGHRLSPRTCPRQRTRDWFATLEAIARRGRRAAALGKLTGLGSAALQSRYPRYDEFVALRDRLDRPGAGPTPTSTACWASHPAAERGPDVATSAPRRQGLSSTLTVPSFFSEVHVRLRRPSSRTRWVAKSSTPSGSPSISSGRMSGTQRQTLACPMRAGSACRTSASGASGRWRRRRRPTGRMVPPADRLDRRVERRQPVDADHHA